MFSCEPRIQARVLALLVALFASGTCLAASLHSAVGIPHLIHQSWKNHSIPAEFSTMIETWRKLHPSWHYRLWSDEANRELVRDHYPWFLRTYNTLPLEIMRADAARCMYMHKFGGMYLDLDFVALKPFDELLGAKSVVLAEMSNDTAFEHNIPNAWMASTPGHPFWLFCLQEITKAAHGCDLGIEYAEWEFVESVAGPAMLKRAVEAYREANRTDLTVLPAGLIYPVDWRQTSPDWNDGETSMEVCTPSAESFNATACIERFDSRPYAVTWWSHTWQR